MEPRSILLTGASGFVGRHLTRALRDAFPTAILHTQGFDVSNAGLVKQTVRAAAPDACIHLAAIAAIPTAQRDSARAWSVNLHGTLNLAHAVLADAPGCFLLYVSSADAYGTSFAAGQPVDETQPLAPMNLYGATKAAADLALGAMVADGLHVVRVRPTNHIGPGQAADFVVGAFAEQAVRIAAGKQPPTMRVGNLDAQRDFLDVRDVCSAYVACLQQAEALVPGTILNVASGIPRSIRDVLESLLTAAGIRPRIELDPARIRAADIPIAIGDARRARTLLGWAPTVPWEQTIADVLAVWRDRIAG